MDWITFSLSSLIGLFAFFLWRKGSSTKEDDAPPRIPSTFPVIGEAISFGIDPINYLIRASEKYGPVFTFEMAGSTFTYLVGSEASKLLFNSKNEQLNAEEVYGRLVTPVFGKGVCYDVPNNVFLEQKKMLKTGLNIARFRHHVDLIEQETKEYFQAWGDTGCREIFPALSELIILTASHCLHGPEVRSMMSAQVAQWYTDLDGGFSHLAWLLPGWLPLPSFRKRDRAHVQMKKLFYAAIAKRRASDSTEDDMLQTLLESTYKDGRKLTDDEVAGMMIGLLMAGQHTSSTTSAWLGLFLAARQDIQQEVFEEQVRVSHSELDSPLDYDQLKECTLLDRCLKETLRLRPPIMTMMRLAKAPQKILGYTIPAGHQVCVSPTTNQRLKDSWKDAEEWNPDRFLDPEASNSEKFSYVPFGAGRHRCIGESFAYVQIKTIWSLLVRRYKFSLPEKQGFPAVNYQTMIHTPAASNIVYTRR